MIHRLRWAGAAPFFVAAFFLFLIGFLLTARRNDTLASWWARNVG